MSTPAAASPAAASPGAFPAASAAGPPSAALERSRRALTVALGVVWLLDAALQYQPYMFTRAFPRQVITPVGAGSPAWVNSPDRWAGHLMAEHIVFWNALFATAQLALALGLFLRRTTKVTLAASVVWSLMVWWLGEGLGGVLAGPQSPVTGLPGAVLVYGLLAVLLWPDVERHRSGTSDGLLSVAESSPLRTAGARVVWVLFWAVFAVETLRPANRARHALSGLIAGAADGEPGWLRHLDHWAAHALVGNGVAASTVLAVVFVALAACVFVPVARRPVLLIGIAVFALIWILGEDLGEIATGQATDPNSGPLLVLLALCYWPLRSRHRPLRTSRVESRGPGV